MSSIGFFFEDVKEIELNEGLLLKHAEYLAKNEKKEIDNIAVIFCSDDYLLKINEEYLGHSYYTDIITFDYCENSFISGDLFISLERISENAIEFMTTYNKELVRVFFHGLLHLCGYKDKTDGEQIEMRTKEDFYLKGIDFDKESV